VRQRLFLVRTWSYFHGSLADLSIYHNQLPISGTVAAQYAAETHQAAELTSVTSPAGRSELSATYDTVNDRVATVTDAVGGTWTYGGAAPHSSSAAYDSAVLSNSPEDFWPLNDTAGPLAQDMVGNAATAASPRPPATYTNVSLSAGARPLRTGPRPPSTGPARRSASPAVLRRHRRGIGGAVVRTTHAGGSGTLLVQHHPDRREPMALWIPKTAHAWRPDLKTL
jgi:hypothetical protein